MAIDVSEFEVDVVPQPDQQQMVKVLRWNVKDLLVQRGIRVGRFGFLAHIFPTAMSNFIKGTPKQVGLKTLLHMKHVLKCSLDDILVEEVISVEEAQKRGLDEDEWIEV